MPSTQWRRVERSAACRERTRSRVARASLYDAAKAMVEVVASGKVVEVILVATMAVAAGSRAQNR